MQSYNKKDSYNRVMAKIFENPTRTFHVRELARQTSLNPNTVLNVLKALRKEALISIQKKKHVVEVSAKTESANFTKLKRIFNLEKIYTSGVIEVLALAFEPDAISIIGSYSRGEDIERSDIDIVLINAKKKANVDLSKHERCLHRKIHLLMANYEEMSEEFYINLVNGIIVHGYIKLRELRNK